MDQIKEKVLTFLDSQTTDKTLAKLQDLGVENLQDLEHLQFDDLTDILKPIQIRKLFRLCSSPVPCPTTSDQSSNPASPESATSSSASVLMPSPLHYSANECNRDPNWPMTLDIQWEDNTDILTQLEEGKRLPTSLRHRLVRSVTDRVRTKTHHASRRQFAIIAQRMVSKYPASLQDKIDHLIIGTGYDSLVSQMVSRNENLNRPKESSALSLRKTSEVEDDTVTPKKKKKVTDSYGCINWGPSLVSTDLCPMEEKRTRLIELHKESPSDYDWDTITGLMSETFPLQRECINGCSEMSEVLKLWPFLGEEKGLLSHFNTLVGIDPKLAITQAYDRKMMTLNRFFQSENCKIKDFATNLFAQAKSEADKNNIKAYIPIGVFCLMKHLGEKQETLFQVVDATKSVADIEVENNINWPVLIFQGDSYLRAEKYSLLVDGVALVQHMNSFISSLAVLFASYYVFNIQYPSEAAATLEFVQRCFLEINPDKGCKTNGKRKTSAVNPRVLRLINELSTYEWC